MNEICEMHIDSLTQTIPMLNYLGLSKTSDLTYILDDKASPLPLPFYSWMNELKKWNLGRGGSLSLWLFGLFFLRHRATVSWAAGTCQRHAYICIHLFLFTSVPSEERRPCCSKCSTLSGRTWETPTKRKKQLPVKARPSFCKVDRLPSENSAGRDALTDFVSRRLQPAQCYWLSRENNPEAEPMC